jgi:hypothetical protein
MTNQVVLTFDSEEDDPRYSIRPEAGTAEERVNVKIDPALADYHGIAVDAQGFPTPASLEAWHRKNNPHLFTD